MDLTLQTNYKKFFKFNQTNVKKGKKQAEEAYSKSEYNLGQLDFRGQRIQIDIKFTKNGRNIVFTSGWMVKQNGFISNNTPLAD